MDFDEYQKKALKTDLMKQSGVLTANDPALMNKVLGIIGESGEIAEKFKKIIRDKNGEISEEDKLEIKKELGDVLWYIASLSEYMGIKFNDVAETNIEKLASRKKRGVGHGSGDNR